jgi:Pyruvate/2-oxoacid:ferredoxin oxidoreductase gamma subunit
MAGDQKEARAPAVIRKKYKAPQAGRQEVVLLGSAGQRVITAGELLCIAGLTAGLKTTQKNEYNITVLRGPSISELILSPGEIDFSGIENPTVMVALDQEGVDRRRDLFERLAEDALIIQIRGVSLPASKARIHQVDFKNQGIKPMDWALASLAVLAKLKTVIHSQMLQAALKIRFKGKVLDSALQLIKKVNIGECIRD